MRPKMIVGLIVCSAIFITGAGIALKSDHGKKSVAADASARPVKVMVLKTSDQIKTRSFPGTLQAANETNLSFRVGGPLVTIDADIGKEFKKGDVLAQIDQRDYKLNVLKLEAALSEANAKLKAMKKGARKEDIDLLKADLTAAQAQFKEAELNFFRHKNLYEEKATAKASFDSVKAGYDMAKARLDAAKFNLEKAKRGARAEDVEAMEAAIKRLNADLISAKNALNDTILTAPFSGFVRGKFVENFETVGPGQPIVTLVDSSAFEVQVIIPEKLRLMQDQFAGFYCRFEAYPEQTFNATLKEIGKTTERSNQGYPLTVELKMPEALRVHPGMAVTLTVETKANKNFENSFQVPISSVFYDNKGKSCLWEVNIAKMAVSKKEIALGELNGNTIPVLSGVSAGSIIVTAGARFLMEDQNVSILNNVKGLE